MSDNFAHDSYHPPEVLNSPQGRPITDPDIRDSILAQITRNHALYEDNLTLEEQMAQRGESFSGGAAVATPEQAAAIEDAFKNATPEERAKYTAKQLAGVADEVTLDDAGKTPGQSPGMESHEDALKRSMENTNDADGSGSTVDSVAKRMEAAEKPTSLEASLANVRLSTERQQRVVITGDEHVRRKFYEILASKGQVFYQGGTPIITAKDKDIPKILQQAASEIKGASVVHALQMEMNRDTPGLLGSIKDRFSNTFGRKHEVTVFAVGDEKQIAEKLDDVKKFVDTLQSAKLVAAGAAPRGESQIRDEKGAPASHQPIELKNLSSLRDVLLHPLDKVAYYNAEQQEKAAARREYRDEKDDKTVADARAKEKDAASGDGSEANRPLHRRTAELAEQFDQQFVKPSLMVTDTGQGQSHALVMAFQAAKIADPAKHELSTLPDESRQKFIAQLSAVVEKVADKEVDHLHKGKPSALPSLEMDKPRRDGTPSARERLADFVKLELKRDDKFAEKLPGLLKEMVAKEALTEAQATRITDRVQAAALELKAASSETPAADAKGATPDTAKTTEAAPTAVATELPEKAADASTAKAGDAVPAKAEVATTEDPVQAPKAGDQAQLFPDTSASDKAATQSAPESAGQPVSATPAATQDASSAKGGADAPVAPEQSPAAPTGLQAKLADLVSQEPSKVSSDSAMSVIATLDAKQSSPLSSLGLGEGEAATKSLARIEGLLEKAQAGVFGPEASAYAGPLKESLDNWKEQNLAAAMSAGKSPAAHADAVDAAKAADPKWHDQVATAQKPGATTLARAEPAPGVAIDATPVAPKDAPSAPQADPVKEAQAAVAVLNMAKTEASAGILAGLLDSPAKYLTHRDKSWNEQGVSQMVDRVMSLDTDSVSKLSPGGAERAVMASVWLTSAAQDGKLPGFDGPEGAAKLEALKLKASELANAVDGVLKPTAAVNDLFLNADKFADRMVSREKELALAAVQSRNELPMRDPTASASASTGADQTRATHEMAKDLVHIAYRGVQPSQQQVKHMLKSAGKLTPQTLKGMDPSTKAQAATALKTLVNEVRNGGLLGDFSKLPQGMKKIVAGAQEASDALHSGLSKDPAMKVELAKAHQELHGPSEKPGKAIEGGTNQQSAAPRPERNSGASMER